MAVVWERERETRRIKVTEGERERVKRRGGGERDNVRRKIQRRYDMRGKKKNKKICFE